MTNEAQFQTTTVVESKNPAADLATIGANTTVGGIFGLNANVAEARGVLITRDVSGNHSAAMIDYNASRETPLVVTERTIAEAVYSRLTDSFDKISQAIE